MPFFFFFFQLNSKIKVRFSFFHPQIHRQCQCNALSWEHSLSIASYQEKISIFTSAIQDTHLYVGVLFIFLWCQMLCLCHHHHHYHLINTTPDIWSTSKIFISDVHQMSIKKMHWQSLHYHHLHHDGPHLINKIPDRMSHVCSSTEMMAATKVTSGSPFTNRSWSGFTLHVIIYLQNL